MRDTPGEEWAAMLRGKYGPLAIVHAKYLADLAELRGDVDLAAFMAEVVSHLGAQAGERSILA